MSTTKTGLNKSVQPKAVSFEVNGYFIRGYTFLQHDPNNVKTASLTVLYDLTGTGADGTIVVSPMPEHQGIKVKLLDVGDQEHDCKLTNFLKASGSGENDLFEFSYHDVQRVVEQDIADKFGIKV